MKYQSNPELKEKYRKVSKKSRTSFKKITKLCTRNTRKRKNVVKRLRIFFNM